MVKKHIHHYPAFYERIVPIALVMIGVILFILLVVTIGVALGLVPGAA